MNVDCEYPFERLMGKNMQKEKYIRNAIMHLNSKAVLKNKIEESEIEPLVKKVVDDLQSPTPMYDFTSYKTLKIKQGDKKRPVKKYEDFSTEQILCQCMKQMLDRKLRIEYPNRNEIIHQFFGFLKAVKTISDFTIIKIDFKDYFNSVSSRYVYEKYIREKMDDREECALLEQFVNQTEYAYTGLATSNLLAEIVALDFDEQVQMELTGLGLIFYKRYIDDTVIILNRYHSEDSCNKILDCCLKKVFYDPKYQEYQLCKTVFNDEKKKIITKREINADVAMDFLGYEIFFSKTQKKLKLQYGITKEKREKYACRMEEFLEEYIDDEKNIELLRHRILAFSSRVVYRRKRFSKSIWRAKGFINNYGELRYFLETDLLHPDTKDFLKNMIKDAFIKKSIPVPEFISNTLDKKGYNLFYNMKANRTILLVENIGYDKKGLERICRQIGINIDDKEYEALVREYLIKTKVEY